MKNKNKQELLLCSFYDGESGFLGTFRARRLIKKDPEARLFYSRLEKADLAGRSYFEGEQAQTGEMGVNLWNKISERIEQEEKAAMFLGARNLRENPQAEQRESPGSLSRFMLAVGGSVAVAGIALFLLIPAQNVNLLDNGLMGSSEVASRAVTDFQGQDPATVSYVSHERPEPLRLIENRLNRAMEVDWMRSQGRVRLIQSPSERSAIIWVKRDHSDSLDTEGDDNQIRIISDRVPVTRSAFGE